MRYNYKIYVKYPYLRRMKFIIGILFLSFTINAFGQQDSGFTNKAEAKNQMVNGLKEGKWNERVGEDNEPSNDTGSHYYRLVIYKAGIPDGLSRQYFFDGILLREVPYKNGVMNGLLKEYYPSGKLRIECPFTNAKINGVFKRYSPDGNYIEETTYTNGAKGTTKHFDIQGNQYDDNGIKIN